MSLDWIYWAISWLLLRWHDLWAAILPGAAFLRTNWDWVLSIVFLVVTVRALLFPLFVKQIHSQRAMQAIQPKVKELQAKHKGDKETLQRELMELYRKEKANPLMGCLPLLLQMPVFLGLFHVLRHLKPDLPLRLRTLYGWTLEQFNSAANAKLFGAPISASFRSSQQELAKLGVSSLNVRIVAGALIAIMIVTTYMTSRQMILKTGWAEDPQQKMVQRLMLYGVPVSLLISGTLFPIGVVIYWVTSNLFSLGQQLWVLRKYPPPKTGAQAAKAGGQPAAKGPAPRKGTDGVSQPQVLGPRPGQKPVNPKKGGPARRPAK